MPNQHNVIAPETVAEIRRELEAIIIRCTEGDKRSDWLSIIERLARSALHRLPSYNAVTEGLCWSSEPHAQSMDWTSLHCRFDRCSGAVVGIYHVPQGCLCWPDPVQALCGQHIITAESIGPIIRIIEHSAQSPSEELLAAEAENNRLREIVDDMRVEVDRITSNAATEIVKFRAALERIALLDEADGHELTVDHAFQAVAIATKALGKHPSEIHAERYTAPLSQGGVTLRELGESYCEEQPAPGAEAVALRSRAYQLGLELAAKAFINGGAPEHIVETFNQAIYEFIIAEQRYAALRSPAMPVPAQGVTGWQSDRDSAKSSHDVPLRRGG